MRALDCVLDRYYGWTNTHHLLRVTSIARSLAVMAMIRVQAQDVLCHPP